MKMEKPSKEVILYLNFLSKTYDHLTVTVSAAKIRWKALNKQGDFKFDDIFTRLDSEKDKINRRIEQLLIHWPIWNYWLSHVDGIGGSTAAALIILYYYKFIPICKECGGDLIKKKDEERNGRQNYICSKCNRPSKGDGMLDHRIEDRDFPRVSNWWSFMGRGADKDTGRMKKKKKGETINWSNRGRVVSYQAAKNFIMRGEDNPYYQVYIGIKRKKEILFPGPAKKLHRDNMAHHEMSKIFLQHFWLIARTIDGKPITEPYVALMGNHNIIKPFFWDDSCCRLPERESHVPLKTHARGASQIPVETQKDIASHTRVETHRTSASHDAHELYT
jgi:hypothetical protein